MADRVLVIALDSVEGTLVQRMMAADRLPTLRRLTSEGVWTDVVSNARKGSASVWPSFITGKTPEEHGIYNEWAWDAPTMAARRPAIESLRPFWADIAEQMTVGVLDVPFAPFIGLDDGFELNEWGAHDRMRGSVLASPHAIEGVVAKYPAHPYTEDFPRTEDPDDVAAVSNIGRVAARGIELRGRLARDLIERTKPRFSMVVFPELHDAGHFLWHTADPGHPTFEGRRFTQRSITPNLEDLHEQVDAEIASLIEISGDDTGVAVMSLHGMRSGIGWPRLAPLLLERAGLLVPATWRNRSARANAMAAFGALKRRAPRGLRELYRKRAGTALQIRMAQPTMIPSHDWKRTKAFPVMDDHAGFIRVNLAGREREGSVAQEAYERVVEEIISAGAELTTEGGAQLVEEIVRPHGVDPNDLLLPDLVLHWTDEAFTATPPQLAEGPGPAPMVRGRTGRHEATGFCISTPHFPWRASSIRTEDLHRVLTAPLSAAEPRSAGG